MKKKTAAKKPRKSKSKMTVVRIPSHMLAIASAVADFTGVNFDDVVKVIFALGIAASTAAEKAAK